MEGTASYIAPPSVKSKLEIHNEINKGVILLEDVYSNTIIGYDPVKTQELHNDGIKSAGPFYWLGAEMTRIIVDEVGNIKLADTIPYGGIAFFKAYLAAVNNSNKTSNLFSKPFTQYILTL